MSVLASHTFAVRVHVPGLRDWVVVSEQVKQ